MASHPRVPFVLVGLLALAFFEFAYILLYLRTSSPMPETASSSDPTSHPIPRLMSEAEANYRQLIARQSGSLRAAVVEYRRRYKRNPPKGFDDWYAFAKENNVKMIDEYDGMINDFAPFWDLSGEEIRRRALQVGLSFGVHHC